MIAVQNTTWQPRQVLPGVDPEERISGYRAAAVHARHQICGFLAAFGLVDDGTDGYGQPFSLSVPLDRSGAHLPERGSD